VSEPLDVSVNAHRLHGQRFGSPTAPLVLALPGLTGTMRHFDVLGEQLGGDDLQFVALDLRGRGLSETTPPGSYGWENHALDGLAVAEVLGHETFAVIGRSMGASVAMKMAELDASRLDAVVLVDVAGRVDPGIGPVIAEEIRRLDLVYESVDAYLDAARADGLMEPWTDDWERAARYDVHEVADGFRSRTSSSAVAEDRAYTTTQHPHDRWKHLTMPTLLLRATRELRPGLGYCVPTDDRDLFLAAVPSASVVEVDANHVTISSHPATAAAIRDFLAGATA
jgi:pimeloyl-ACP methyl ester carboxylesterase